jgi:hypothetical protein
LNGKEVPTGTSNSETIISTSPNTNDATETTENRVKVFSPIKPKKVVSSHIRSALFSPVLLSLAELNRPDLLVDILTQEMPRAKVVPTPTQVTVSIRALFQAGKFDEGVELFFQFFEPIEASSPSSSTESEAPTKLPVKQGAVLAALECCASGGLGAQALRVLPTVSIFCISSLNTTLLCVLITV